MGQPTCGRSTPAAGVADSPSRAGELDFHCPLGYVEAVVSTGGRAYVFDMTGPGQRPLFESFLATVTLMPESAKN